MSKCPGRFIVAVVAIAFSLMPSAVAEPEELRTLKLDLAAAVLKSKTTFEAAKKKLDELYLKHLETLQKEHQNDSDLQAALAVRNEVERFGNGNQLTAGDLVSKPKALLDGQKKYLGALAKHSKKQLADETAAYGVYVSKLQSARSALTKAGKLDDAVVVDKEPASILVFMAI